MPPLIPPPARAGARTPVRYCPELGRALCARIAAGETQRALSLEPGMPCAWTMRDWARRIPEFGALYHQARREAQTRQLAQERRANEGRKWRRMLTRVGRRGGSVSIYTPELAEAICRRLAAGETVLSVGADPAMPCASTICGWVRCNDEFRDMYLRAKDIAADLLFDLAYEIALEATEATVQADRLRISTLRWHTALLAPKKYGLRRAMAPADREDDEAGRGMTVILRRFEDPDDGPQYVDLQGRAVARPD
jgi:hypothetical protein